METRTDEQIIENIKMVLDDYVTPAVNEHGGVIKFLSYNDGNLDLMLGGACSGCAGSLYTLQQGVEEMVKHFVPEVKNITASDDPDSQVNPYYTHDPYVYDEYYFDDEP